MKNFLFVIVVLILLTACSPSGDTVGVLPDGTAPADVLTPPGAGETPAAGETPVAPPPAADTPKPMVDVSVCPADLVCSTPTPTLSVPELALEVARMILTPAVTPAPTAVPTASPPSGTPVGGASPLGCEIGDGILHAAMISTGRSDLVRIGTDQCAFVDQGWPVEGAPAPACPPGFYCVGWANAGFLYVWEGEPAAPPPIIVTFGLRVVPQAEFCEWVSGEIGYHAKASLEAGISPHIVFLGEERAGDEVALGATVILHGCTFEVSWP